MKKLNKIKLLSEHSEVFDNPAGEIEAAENGETEIREKNEKRFLKKITGMKSGLKPKIKPIPWKVVFSGRNMLIISCIALIGLAGYLNVKFYSPTDSEPLGNEISVVGGEKVADEAASKPENEENYYATAVINRERVRDEAIDTLKEITESETSSIGDKEDAYSQMSKLADESTYEVNIENLVKAKGFEKCVAVVSGDGANIIVSPHEETLSESDVAQIKEIVYLESGVLPTDIKIIEKN